VGSRTDSPLLLDGPFVGLVIAPTNFLHSASVLHCKRWMLQERVSSCSEAQPQSARMMELHFRGMYFTFETVAPASSSSMMASRQPLLRSDWSSGVGETHNEVPVTEFLTKKHVSVNSPPHAIALGFVQRLTSLTTNLTQDPTGRSFVIPIVFVLTIPAFSLAVGNGCAFLFSFHPSVRVATRCLAGLLAVLGSLLVDSVRLEGLEAWHHAHGICGHAGPLTSFALLPPTIAKVSVIVAAIVGNELGEVQVVLATTGSPECV